MRVEELLELLANESRRRIIELLSRKPCYVSEISYSLRMAPKVVLEHLEKLEKAGIVKSFEEGRRRYYYIEKPLSLSITITPYRFVTNVSENALSAEEVFKEIRELFEKKSMTVSDFIRKASEIERKITALQRSVSEFIDRVIERALSEISRTIESEMERMVALELLMGEERAENIAEKTGLPYSMVAKILEEFEKRGLVERRFEDGKAVYKLRMEVV
ncbi:metalloregulator ArsR/SmtB family transcription factor [Ferroglobus sp.]|uniref:metalloregulator ArsR/SmtB family transcription factor n=1 Tax=Ferroglobus sp. TaxID=2614230 RepID=UPI0025C41135|nr:metalloregulator ArsR/SmtB family transcription factor [Ferroglobus sp.]